MYDIPLSEFGMDYHQYVQFEGDQGHVVNDGYRCGCTQPEQWREQFIQPDVEDCEGGVVPYKAEPMDGKKQILVPVLTTMNKYLFDHYRLPIYTYVNRLLRNGTLSKIVGARILNSVMNRNTLSFLRVSFWRIDRTSFYADVQVQLTLDTENGTLIWGGYLVLWCGFDEKFECSFECLTDTVERKDDGFDQLDSYLVPYYDNKRVDKVAERIWATYLPEALNNPEKRSAIKLAARMGLSVKACRVYEHGGLDAILFFEACDLVVGVDRAEKDGCGRIEYMKDKEPSQRHIPADTIVVNENRVRWDYSDYHIFHECFHNEEHYMFYRLQKMGSNDPRKVEMRACVVDADEDPTDPIYFMEMQANRGAYGLMLPATSTRELITNAYCSVAKSRHAGERYEIVGKEIAQELRLPHFRIRARMIQLGCIQAKGALNYVERQLIQPFAFDTDRLRHAHDSPVAGAHRTGDEPRAFP